MTPGQLGVLVPVFALAIPIVAIISSALQKLARLRIEEARVRAGSLDAGTAAEVQALREEVTELHRDLEELHERMDFAERMLAQARERERLPGPAEGSRP